VCIGLNAHPRRTAVISGGSPVSRSIEHETREREGERKRERERERERERRGELYRRQIASAFSLAFSSRGTSLSLSRRRSADPEPRLSSSCVSLMRFDRRRSLARAARLVVIVVIVAAPASSRKMQFRCRRARARGNTSNVKRRGSFLSFSPLPPSPPPLLPSGIISAPSTLRTPPRSSR